MSINFISNNGESVTLSNSKDSLKVFFAENRSTGVRGVVDEDALGPGRERG